MEAAEYQDVTDRFVEFSRVAKRFIHIRSKRDFRETLELLEELMGEADDSASDPLNDLINVLAASIEAYEAKQASISRFHEEAENLDPSVSALRLLMQQHALGVSGFAAEIGSKSLVSMILSGQRALTKDHIARLSARFGVSPAVFF